MKTTQRPSLERASELLEYNPETGLLLWSSPPANHPRLYSKAAGSITTGYVLIKIDGTKHKGHHLAWLLTHGEWPGSDVDHKNCCPLDNRIDNLRLATNPQNQANRTRNRGKWIAKGVRVMASGHFNARITVDKQQINLGVFSTETEAAYAYMYAARHHYGEFARAS